MPEYVDAPIREDLFNDDVKMIADLLESQWSLPDRFDKPETFAYEPEQMMTNPIAPERGGKIYIYMVSRSNRPASIDYKTLDRTTTIGIKLTCRYRDTLFRWGEEIYRIIMANRRTGVKHLNGAIFMEITDEQFSNDLSGLYSDTIDVKLTRFHASIRSDGFGDTINREIEHETTEDTGDP